MALSLFVFFFLANSLPTNTKFLSLKKIMYLVLPDCWTHYVLMYFNAIGQRENRGFTYLQLRSDMDKSIYLDHTVSCWPYRLHMSAKCLTCWGSIVISYVFHV